jgi:predicted acyltransferase
VQTVPAKRPRLASLDQFRGYTVVGMVLVNFLGGYDAWMPPVLLHHHTYCSYADTIMPHFLFAVGFAMRLSFGRHVHDEGLVAGYWRMVRRIVGLLLVSFAVYTSGRAVEHWHEVLGRGTWDIAWPYLKREWLQTLGHIAITSLWILPVIRSGAAVRIAYAVLSGAAHVVLSHWFHYHWVNTDPNGIDGGPLGFLTWSIPAILGTVTCDMILDAPTRAPIMRLMGIAVLVMGLGYVFSCGTRLYDLSPADIARVKQERKAQDEERKRITTQIDALRAQIAAHWKASEELDAKIADARRAPLAKAVSQMESEPANAGRPRGELIDAAQKALPKEAADSPVGKLQSERDKLAQGDAEAISLEHTVAELRNQARSLRDVKLAPSPVIPPAEAWRGRTWQTLLAEPPFVQPPADDSRVDSPPYELHRYWNYWMMTQRGGSLSYLTFGAGFSLFVYLLFYIVSDLGGIRIGLFRTFGSNALAAYVLASIIGEAIQAFIPRDAPSWYVLTAFGVDFLLLWLFIRSLEKNNIFLRV